MSDHSQEGNDSSSSRKRFSIMNEPVEGGGKSSEITRSTSSTSSRTLSQTTLSPPRTEPPVKKQRLVAGSTSQIKSLTSTPSRAAPTPSGSPMSLSARISDILSHIEAQEPNEKELEHRIFALVKMLDDCVKEPEPLLFNGLLYFCKRLPSVFAHQLIFPRLLGYLGRTHAATSASGQTQSFRRAGSSFVALLSCNLIYFSLKQEPEWPVELFQVYLDDSLGSRSWVDDESASPLVERITSGLQLNVPESSPWKDPATRRLLIQSTVTQIEAAFLQWQKNSDANLLRNILAVISVGIEQVEIRASTVDRIFSLFLQTATARFFRLLVAHLSGTTGTDLEIVNQILQLKDRCALSHQNRALYMDLVSQIARNNPEYPRLVLRHVLVSEYLKEPKPQPWIQLITSICNCIPSGIESYFGQIFAEFSAQGAIRPMLPHVLQKIVRESRQKTTPRYHFNLPQLANALLIENLQAMPSTDNPLLSIFCVVDMVVACCILSVPTEEDESTVRMPVTHAEALVEGKSEADVTRAPLEEVSPISHKVSDDNESSGYTHSNSMAREWATFRSTVALIQAEALRWCHTVVIPYLGNAISHPQFTLIIKKILFLQSAPHYFGDRCQNTFEKQLYFTLTHQIPVLEETLTRLIIISLSGLPLFPADALWILDQLILRAATLQTQCNDPILKICNKQLLHAILKLCQYQGPSTKPEHPPFVVVAWFWQTQLMILLLVAFNPECIVDSVDEFPSLLNLIEMIIAQRWTDSTEAIVREAKLRQEEAPLILAFEKDIFPEEDATSAVSSILLPQLMLQSHEAISSSYARLPRLPPPPVVDRLRYLDAQLQLQFRYCRVRQPDFLALAMTRRAVEASHTWLLNVVEADPDLLDTLPVACLWDLFFDLIAKAHSTLLSTIHLSRIVLRLKSSFFRSDAALLDAFSFLSERLLNLKSGCRHLFHQVLAFLFNLESPTPGTKALHGAASSDWLSMASRLPLLSHGDLKFIHILEKQLQLETQLTMVGSILDFLRHFAADRYPLVLADLLLHRPLFLLWKWATQASFRSHLLHYLSAILDDSEHLPEDSKLQSPLLISLSIAWTYLPPDEGLRLRLSRHRSFLPLIASLDQTGALGPHLPFGTRLREDQFSSSDVPCRQIFSAFLSPLPKKPRQPLSSRADSPTIACGALAFEHLFTLVATPPSSSPYAALEVAQLPVALQQIMTQRSAWFQHFFVDNASKLDRATWQSMINDHLSHTPTDPHVQSALVESLGLFSFPIVDPSLAFPFIKNHLDRFLPLIFHSSSVHEMLHFIPQFLQDASEVSLRFFDAYFLTYSAYLKHLVMHQYYPLDALKALKSRHSATVLAQHPFLATLTDQSALPRTPNHLQFYCNHLSSLSHSELSIQRLIHRVVNNLLAEEEACRANSYASLVRIARSHPVVLVDGFELLLSTLQGKTDAEVSVLVSRAHDLLFWRILEIARILYPCILTKSHAILGLFDCFFSLAHYLHREIPEIAPLIDSFSQFALLVSRANVVYWSYLQKRVRVLQTLSGFYAGIPTLWQLRDHCSATFQERHGHVKATENEQAQNFLLRFNPRSESWTPGMDGHSMLEEMLRLPVELQTEKRFVLALTEGFYLGNRKKRALAFELILKLLTNYATEVAPIILEPYLKSLNDDDLDVQSIALSYVTRFFPSFSKSDAKKIILELFALGEIARTELACIYNSLTTHSMNQ